MCVKQISTALTVIQTELARIQKFADMSIEQIVEDAGREISAARQEMHRAIDSFYDNILKDYEVNIRQAYTKTFDFTEVERELRMAHEELESLDSQLKDDRYMINAIKRVCILDMSRFVLFYQEKVRDCLGQGMTIPFDILFTEKDYPAMHEFIMKFLVEKPKIIGLSQRNLEHHKEHDLQLKLQNDEAAKYFDRKIVSTL